MKYCSEFFEIYTTFQALVKTQCFVVIKCFRCDLGDEYTSNKFYELLTLDGIIHQTLYTDTPEQNGVVEKNIGTLSKLIVLSCYLLLFLVNFGEKLSLLLQV
jgi:hypothetical protein